MHSMHPLFDQVYSWLDILSALFLNLPLFQGNNFQSMIGFHCINKNVS